MKVYKVVIHKRFVYPHVKFQYNSKYLTMHDWQFFVLESLPLFPKLSTGINQENHPRENRRPSSLQEEVGVKTSAMSLLTCPAISVCIANEPPLDRNTLVNRSRVPSPNLSLTNQGTTSTHRSQRQELICRIKSVKIVSNATLSELPIKHLDGQFLLKEGFIKVTPFLDLDDHFDPMDYKEEPPVITFRFLRSKVVKEDTMILAHSSTLQESRCFIEHVKEAGEEREREDVYFEDLYRISERYVIPKLRALSLKTMQSSLNMSISIRMLTNQPREPREAVRGLAGQNQEGRELNSVQVDLVLNTIKELLELGASTGTGETFTTEGDLRENFGECSRDVGIIPRTLYTLFAALEKEDTRVQVRESGQEHLEHTRDQLDDVKKAFVKECLPEMDRLKAKLNATREKEGVFTMQESYRVLVDKSPGDEDFVTELQKQVDRISQELERVEEMFRENLKVLLSTKQKLFQSNAELEVEHAEVQELKNELDIQDLHEKLEKQRAIERESQEAVPNSIMTGDPLWRVAATDQKPWLESPLPVSLDFRKDGKDTFGIFRERGQDAETFTAQLEGMAQATASLETLESEPSQKAMAFKRQLEALNLETTSS
ncbi:MAG: hypothetical protein J3Q66DRAFT_364648 [Benniella sp.]|nr:MAG: hypothetical protein J3Q66DRAFT_364648 [Benniella sp.]